MGSEDHDRLSDIFLEASDLEPDERGSYLDRACSDDSDLRARVEKLLLRDRADPPHLGAHGQARLACGPRLALGRAEQPWSGSGLNYQSFR